MICQLCKHEWCWICKQAFPVHLSSCPNYHLYLEILSFQGADASQILEGDDAIHPNGWFLYSGGTGGACFWVCSLLFLLILGLPSIVIFNLFVTPVYMLALLFSLCGFRRSSIDGRVCMITMIVFAFLLLYSAAPVVFLIVTLPQIVFHLAKKYHELKDLCRNRCRRYRKLNVTPINNRLLRFIGMQ